MRAGPAVTVVAGVALLVGGLQSAGWSSAAQVRQVQSLRGQSDLLATSLAGSFERARGLTLLLAHYRRVAGAAAGTAVARADAEEAVSYLESMYPGQIDQARVIEESGRELVRVTRGHALPLAALGSDESGFAFFPATMALSQGQVHLSTPYVSPDTHTWVLASSTWVPGPTGRRVVLQLELALAGFQGQLDAAADAQVAVVDDAAGRVVLRGGTAQPATSRPAGPAGSSGLGVARPATLSDATWDPETTPQQAWSAFPAADWGDRPPVSSRSVDRGVGNENHWSVVAWPAGGDAGVPAWLPLAAALAGLAVLALALLLVRHRESALRRAATRDRLTSLVNREGLIEAAARAGLVPGSPPPDGVAVLVLDLDGFKPINDTHGHPEGDAVLQEVARRLRELTGPDGVAARLGGDTFAVLLTAVPADQVSRRAHRLREALIRPVEVDGAAHFVGVSMGAAVVPGHGETVEELLRNADAAMHRAKRARDGVHVYDRGTVEGAADSELAAELMVAIDTEQVYLALQPLHDATTREIIGVEALARWNRPGHGPVPPDRFVALAERAGMIRGLTHLVLRQALDEAAYWRRHGIHLPISVNLSPYLVTDESLPDHVAAELAARGLPAGALVLEVTESAAVEAEGAAGRVLHALRSTGVQIELDDFGSGYASFGAMANLPLDGVKLDRALVVEQGKAAEGPRLLAATVEMAHALGLTVVAEGIEDETMLAMVRDIGCDRVQGYLLNRPLPPQELRARLGCPELVVVGE